MCSFISSGKVERVNAHKISEKKRGAEEGENYPFPTRVTFPVCSDFPRVLTCFAFSAFPEVNGGLLVVE